MSAKRKSFVAAAHPAHVERGKATLSAEERLWQRTFNSVPDLVAIIDHNYRIVRVNQAMTKKLGRSPIALDNLGTILASIEKRLPS